MVLTNRLEKKSNRQVSSITSHVMIGAKIMVLLGLIAFASGQVQYTIDAKIDNSFFHELISPSIANNNIHQNIYSRYGGSVTFVVC
jgi:hypothetical protein